MLLCISAIGVSAEKKVEATFMKQTTNDLDTSATGYIYQQSGNNPAQVIYFNKGDALGRLNEGEMLSRLNQGEVISDLNQGEILPHLHLKTSNLNVHPAVHTPVHVSAHTPSLPYVYQQPGATAVNPGRSTSQAYYVTHYQDYGNNNGNKYTTHHPLPVSHYIGHGKGIDGGAYPHYDIAKNSYGVYNPLSLNRLPGKPVKTPGLSHYPTVDKHPESIVSDDDSEEDDDESEEEHAPLNAYHDAHLVINIYSYY